ncbi:MAG: amidohydrolase [Candidatus Eisenbacteria bacterium]|uniref:Amidohydrolase n=1 Tax=Eiseniibacteriota bacterium TaxID=2212470 RepID=A0A7Y2ECK0_UNCEI|nr:amidohydrolase [Candidatus Eisenbacteria bacterium]
MSANAEDLVFHGGVVWTGNPSRPWAQAVWIRNGLIRAVDTDEEVLSQAPIDAKRVSLDGAFVSPGLTDGHAHLISLGQGADQVDLVGAESLSETLGRVQVAVTQRQAEESGGWIQGRGWDQNDWPEKAFPSREDLDRVSGDFPVALRRIDAHATWVNTRALTEAGITAATKDPSGGKIHRDSQGEPTGILIDNAGDLVADIIPKPGPMTIRRYIRQAAQALIRVGVTGVHDMGMSATELDVYRQMAAEEFVPQRVYAAFSVTDPQLPDVLAAGADPEWQGWFRLGMVKFYLDGALGSRGAALLRPYEDDPSNQGLFVSDRAQVEADLEACLNAGFQIAMHGIGDAANRMALEVWGETLEKGAKPSVLLKSPFPSSFLGDVSQSRPSFRIEHAQVIHPNDLDRFADLGVVASIQPTHCTSDMPWAPDRLGQDRLAGAYAWRSLRTRGVLLVSGSDFPVESHNPLYGLYAAVTRQPVSGESKPGWAPEERLDRSEALVSFTAAPAYASGDLHQWGTLQAGKKADLVIWSENLVTCDPEKILDADCVLTMIDGVVVWTGPTFSWDSE